LDRQTDRHSTDNKSLYSSRTNSQCQMHQGRACVTTEDNAISIYAQEYLTAYNIYFRHTDTVNFVINEPPAFIRTPTWDPLASVRERTLYASHYLLEPWPHALARQTIIFTVNTHSSVVNRSTLRVDYKKATKQLSLLN